MATSPEGPPPLPRVTPSLLHSAGELCTLRLAREFEGAPGSDDPVNRARLRGAFLEGARAVHAVGGAPRLDLLRAPGHLEPEERAVFDQATRWYGALFGNRPVTTHLHDCEQPTLSPGRGVRVGGWVDLTVVGDDGTKELRQLDLWGGRPPQSDDPLDLESVLLAVLRTARWVGEEPLLVSWTDLVRGRQVERTVLVAEELPNLRTRFEALLTTVIERTADPVASPGRDCGECRHVRGCPEFVGSGNARDRSPRGDFRPAILRLTPTSLDTWHRCVRAWRNRLLAVTPSDEGDAPAHAHRLHDVLRFLHEQGSCADAVHVAGVLDSHGADERLRTEVARHVTRCPSPSRALGHEATFARFHGRPGPPFLGTARIDAAWLHDDVLDARDYKTGRKWHTTLSEDPRARLQAWVLARQAADADARLRIRYEYLAAEVDEDPEPWDPDEEELAAIEEELEATVAGMRGRSDWHGVGDPAVCGWCSYRSICPDSAAPAEPAWPSVEHELTA